MSACENKTVVERFLASLGEAARTVGSTGQPAPQAIVEVAAAFPGYTLWTEEVVAEEDRVAVRFTLAGVHQGVYLGIPPSGKRVRASGVAICRVADGGIADCWLQIDALNLVQQLGVSP